MPRWHVENHSASELFTHNGETVQEEADAQSR